MKKICRLHITHNIVVQFIVFALHSYTANLMGNVDEGFFCLKHDNHNDNTSNKDSCFN